MNHEAINFNQKLNSFNEHWKPKVIAEMNDYQFKLVKLLLRMISGFSSLFMCIKVPFPECRS